MEKVDLEFLACQLDRLLDAVADLKDDMAVLKARLERLEATNNVALAQVRANQNRYERWTRHVDGLEDRDHSDAS